MEDGRPICHVSLLLTTATGMRIVVDNGHVLEAGPTGGVASYREFAKRVAHHWTDPRADSLAAAP